MQNEQNSQSHVNINTRRSSSVYHRGMNIPDLSLLRQSAFRPKKWVNLYKKKQNVTEMKVFLDHIFQDNVASNKCR
jgi:hypothetical protein